MSVGNWKNQVFAVLLLELWMFKFSYHDIFFLGLLSFFAPIFTHALVL